MFYSGVVRSRKLYKPPVPNASVRRSFQGASLRGTLAIQAIVLKGHLCVDWITS